MTRRALAVLLAAAIVWTAGSCSGEDDAGGALPTTDTSSAGPDPGTASSADAPESLPVGKDDLELEQGVSYLSPEGFVPELRLDLTQAGWTSVHRDADGFDVGQANPNVDAPLVAVAFLVPPEATAEAALDAVRQNAEAAGGRLKELPDPLGPFGSTGVDVRDGQGPLVASRDGGIALDAVPGGRVQVWAGEVAGAPILVAVLVPDRRLWSATGAAVQELLASVSPA